MLARNRLITQNGVLSNCLSIMKFNGCVNLIFIIFVICFDMVQNADKVQKLYNHWLGLKEESDVMTPQDYIHPSKDGFGADPLGYGALAWHKWGMAQTLAGYPVDLEKGPSSDDLKSPVLWLSHAHAMSEAARVVLQGDPNLDPMPENIR